MHGTGETALTDEVEEVCEGLNRAENSTFHRFDESQMTLPGDPGGVFGPRGCFGSCGVKGAFPVGGSISGGVRGPRLCPTPHRKSISGSIWNESTELYYRAAS